MFCSTYGIIQFWTITQITSPAGVMLSWHAVGGKKTDSSTRICVNISLWLSIVRYTQMTGKKFYQQWKNISDGQNFSLMQWIGHDADMSKFQIYAYCIRCNVFRTLNSSQTIKSKKKNFYPQLHTHYHKKVQYNNS